MLFGSDAFDGGVEQGWERVAWVGTTTARRGLAIALTGMMRDGEITRARKPSPGWSCARTRSLRTTWHILTTRIHSPTLDVPCTDYSSRAQASP